MKELNNGWEEFKATDRILIFESVVYGFAYCQALVIIVFLFQLRNRWKHVIYLSLAVAEYGIICFLTGRLAIAFLEIKFQPDVMSDVDFGLLIWAIVGMLFAKYGYALAAAKRTQSLAKGRQQTAVKVVAAIAYIIIGAEVAVGFVILATFVPVTIAQNRLYHGVGTIEEVISMLPQMLISLAVEPAINTLLTIIVNMSFLYTMFIRLNVPYAKAVKILSRQGDVLLIVAATVLAVFDCATSSNIATVTFQTQLLVFLRVTFETSKDIMVTHESTLRTTQKPASTIPDPEFSTTNDQNNIKGTSTIVADNNV